jgi:hypothetical protein
MRLLYTLRYASYSGNCGGDLRLFFTTQNSADWQASPPAPPPGMWLLPPNVAETLTLPSGDSLNFSLYPVNNASPGLLYLYGAIIVTTAAGQILGSTAIGQSSGPFAPNQAVVAILKGRSQGNVGGISWDIGFDLAVPWDGTSADCCGHWWAIWDIGTTAPSAPTNLHTGIT